jgi:hypothetical protein
VANIDTGDQVFVLVLVLMLVLIMCRESRIVDEAVYLQIVERG